MLLEVRLSVHFAVYVSALCLTAVAYLSLILPKVSQSTIQPYGLYDVTVAVCLTFPLYFQRSEKQWSLHM